MNAKLSFKQKIVDYNYRLIVFCFISSILSININAQKDKVSIVHNLSVFHTPHEGFHWSVNPIIEMKSHWNGRMDKLGNPVYDLVFECTNANNIIKIKRSELSYSYQGKLYSRQDLIEYPDLLPYFDGYGSGDLFIGSGVLFEIPLLKDNYPIGIVRSRGFASFELPNEFTPKQNEHHPLLADLDGLTLGVPWEIKRIVDAGEYKNSGERFFASTELNYIFKHLPTYVQALKAYNNGEYEKVKVTCEKYKADTELARNFKTVSETSVYHLDNMVNELSNEVNAELNNQRQVEDSVGLVSKLDTNSITDLSKNDLDEKENGFEQGFIKEDVSKKTYTEKLTHYTSIYGEDYSNISKQSWEMFEEFDTELHSRLNYITNQINENKDFWNGLKISPKLTPPDQILLYNEKLKAVVEKHNQDLNHAMGLATQLLEQNSGEQGALTGALIVGGVGALSAKSSQNDAKEQLLIQLTNNFKEIQNELLQKESAKLEQSKLNAVQSLSAESERYYLKDYEYWLCRVNGIENGFSISNTSWVDPKCTLNKLSKPKEEIRLNSEEYFQVAQRKHESTYNFLNPYSYDYLDKSISLDKSNVNPAISYYVWREKEVEKERSEKHKAVLGVMLRAEGDKVFIQSILENSSFSEQSQLDEGDQLVSFCGYPINNVENVLSIMSDRSVGQKGIAVVKKESGELDTVQVMFKKELFDKIDQSSSYLNLAVNANANDKRVQDAVTYHMARKDNTTGSYRSYLKLYPKGIFSTSAEKSVEYLSELQKIENEIKLKNSLKVGEGIAFLRNSFPSKMDFQDFEDYDKTMKLYARYNLETLTEALKPNGKNEKLQRVKELYKVKTDFGGYLDNPDVKLLNRKINALRNSLHGTDMSTGFGISIFNKTGADFAAQYNNQGNISEEKIYYSNKEILWNTFTFDMELRTYLFTLSGPVYMGMEVGFELYSTRNAVVLDRDKTNEEIIDIIDGYNEANGAVYGNAYHEIGQRFPDTLFIGTPSRSYIGFHLSNLVKVRYNRFSVVNFFEERHNWMKRSGLGNIIWNTNVEIPFIDRTYDNLSLAFEIPLKESKHIYFESSNFLNSSKINFFELGLSLNQVIDVTCKYTRMEPWASVYYQLQNTSKMNGISNGTGDVFVNYFAVNIKLKIPSYVGFNNFSRRHTRFEKVFN